MIHVPPVHPHLSHLHPLATCQLGLILALTKHMKISVPVLRTFYRLWRVRQEVLSAHRQQAGAGYFPSIDSVTPDEIPSHRSKGVEDRVLAEIDQDGFLFAVHEDDRAYFNQRDIKLQRNRYGLEVVQIDGAICVRKQFKRQPFRKGLSRWVWSCLGLPFYNEAAALLRLKGLPFVPSLHSIDLDTRTLYIEYIRGDNLQRHIAGLDERLYDIGRISDSPSTEEEREQREIELFERQTGPELKHDILEMVRHMNARGVIPLDIKPGNLVIGGKTDRPYWIDFERAHLDAYDHFEEKLEEQSFLLKKWIRSIH